MGRPPNTGSWAAAGEWTVTGGVWPPVSHTSSNFHRPTALESRSEFEPVVRDPHGCVVWHPALLVRGVLGDHWPYGLARLA